VYGISLQHILNETAILLGFKLLDPFAGNRENWDTLACFSRIIGAFETPRYHPTDQALNDFCWYTVNHRSQILKGLRDEQDTDIPDAVQVMTMHAAKGLDFAAVFMPCCVEWKFPEEEWTFLEADSFDSKRYCSSIADERRLFYVGMTRSRKFLFITSCEEDEMGSKAPSRFLHELDDTFCIKTDMPDPTKRTRITDRLPASVQEEKSLEWPAVAEYMDCGLKYFFRYKLGFRSPVAAPMGYIRGLEHILNEPGTAAICEGKRIDTEAIQKAVDQKLFLRYASKKQKGMLQQTAAQTIKHYLEAVKKHKVPLQFTDRQFCLLLGTGTLTGNHPEALDEKTGTAFIPLITFGNEIDLSTDRDIEGGLFAIASGKNNAQSENIHDIIVTRRSCRVKVKKIKERYKQKVKTRIEQAMQGIKAEQFNTGPCKRKACRTCDWQIFCPLR
jgi:DNA helicase-2/ATP-dependent DNA helicase PcrA